MTARRPAAEPDRLGTGVWSRRRFLGAMGASGALVALAACGSPEASSLRASAAGTLTFLSRPDLRPPRLEVVGPAGQPGAGYVFVTAGAPLIVDDRGSPIWYRPVPHASTNLRVQRYEGAPVLTWWQGEITHYGVGQQGEVVIVDTSYREVRRVRAANGLTVDLHEFVIAGDGTAYLTAYREVTADLSAVGGPKRGRMLDVSVQGIDLATGALVFDWHSADHIDISESYQTYSKQSAAPYDPVHVNSIDPTADGNLLISARNTWALYKLDRATGEIIWRLGGKKNQFRRGPGVHFAWQHDARSHPGNLLSLFDDEGDPPEARQSRGLVLAVDETAMTADLVHAYLHPGKPLLAGSQGSVQLLPDGDVVVGWGAEPYYTEYRQDGEVVLDGRFLTGQSYRAFRFPWAATPTEAPAIAARRRSPNRLEVYASWNGATEVHHWSVLGGARRDRLSEVGAANRTGFETPVEVVATVPVAYVAARAVDRDGRVLATSPVIRV